jgi:hypothetical protein
VELDAVTGDGLKELLDASSRVAAADEIALYCLAVSPSSCRVAAVDENILNYLATSPLPRSRRGREHRKALTQDVYVMYIEQPIDLFDFVLLVDVNLAWIGNWQDWDR